MRAPSKIQETQNNHKPRTDNRHRVKMLINVFFCRRTQKIENNCYPAITYRPPQQRRRYKYPQG